MYAESRITLAWLCLGLWLRGRWRDEGGSSGCCLFPKGPGPPVTSSYPLAATARRCRRCRCPNCQAAGGAPEAEPGKKKQHVCHVKSLWTRVQKEQLTPGCVQVRIVYSFTCSREGPFLSLAMEILQIPVYICSMLSLFLPSSSKVLQDDSHFPGKFKVYLYIFHFFS